MHELLSPMPFFSSPSLLDPAANAPLNFLLAAGPADGRAQPSPAAFLVYDRGAAPAPPQGAARAWRCCFPAPPSPLSLPSRSLAPTASAPPFRSLPILPTACPCRPPLVHPYTVPSPAPVATQCCGACLHTLLVNVVAKWGAFDFSCRIRAEPLYNTLHLCKECTGASSGRLVCSADQGVPPRGGQPTRSGLHGRHIRPEEDLRPACLLLCGSCYLCVACPVKHPEPERMRRRPQVRLQVETAWRTVQEHGGRVLESNSTVE